MKKTERMDKMTLVGEQCRVLKLPAFLEGLHKQEGGPQQAERPFLDRIADLLDAEIQSRQIKRCARLFKESGIRDLLPSVDRIVYEPDRGLNRHEIEDLADCRWITHEPPLNVTVTGMAGTGKTWLMKALGKEAIQRGFSTSYWRAADLIDRLRQARQDGEPVQFRNRLNSKRLLIIDDFAMTPMDEQTRDDFFSLIEERTMSGSMMIGSQRDFEDWYRYIGDKYHADAILDRLRNSSYMLRLKGRSFRERTESAQLTKGDASQ